MILINLFLLYLRFRNLLISMIVFGGIPVAAAGGMIAAAVVGVEMNTATWIGFIALFGIAADVGVVIATECGDVRHTVRQTQDSAWFLLSRKPA